MEHFTTDIAHDTLNDPALDHPNTGETLQFTSPECGGHDLVFVNDHVRESTHVAWPHEPIETKPQKYGLRMINDQNCDLKTTLSSITRSETMYDLQEARIVLEEIKKRAAAGDFANFVTVSCNDISTVLAPLQSLARCPEMIWQIQQAQIIQVKPVSDVIPIARDRYRAKRNANWKEGYFNAVKVSRKLGASYCEGWVVSPRNGVLIRHAWNRVNGDFFDVTGELLYDDFDNRLYVVSFETGSQEAQELWKYAKNHFFGNPLLATAYWEKEREQDLVKRKLG